MTFRLYALKYAELNGRQRSEVFLGKDIHDRAIDMAYYIWVAVPRQGGATVIDTGFTEATARKRGRVFLEQPVDLLARIGVDPAAVRDVVITHLHYDHAGNFALFPNARFHIQDAEMAYATGRSMTHSHVRKPFELEDVIEMVRNVYGERAVFHDGDATVLPGINVYKVGGHSRGLQFASVETDRGRVAIASDAAHYYESFENDRIFAIVDDVTSMISGFRRLREIGGRPDLIVPGHDPEVMRRYPPPSPNDEGRVVALHEIPN